MECHPSSGTWIDPPPPLFPGNLSSLFSHLTSVLHLMLWWPQTVPQKHIRLFPHWMPDQCSPLCMKWPLLFCPPSQPTSTHPLRFSSNIYSSKHQTPFPTLIWIRTPLLHLTASVLPSITTPSLSFFPTRLVSTAKFCFSVSVPPTETQDCYTNDKKTAQNHLPPPWVPKTTTHVPI